MDFKFKSVVLFFAVVTAIGFSSCDDEQPAPTITGLELGMNNSGTANIGDELHMDAEIDAPGKIAKIEVELHPESGSGDDIEAEFTNYAGQLNADFHEHIEIANDSTLIGEYHFHLKVTDEQGKITEEDGEVEIQ